MSCKYALSGYIILNLLLLPVPWPYAEERPASERCAIVSSIHICEGDKTRLRLRETESGSLQLTCSSCYTVIVSS